MAQVFILAQVRSPEQLKLQVRGVFSQKKKLWEVLEKLTADTGGLASRLAFDDVSGKERDVTYSVLCNMLTNIGRVTLKDKTAGKEFLVVASQMNDVREWDTDDAGNCVPNPVKKDDTAEGGNDDTSGKEASV